MAQIEKIKAEIERLIGQSQEGLQNKPAEWSEEDEGMLNCIIATLCEESHGGRETNDKMVAWLENRLKSLHPQPKAHDLKINGWVERDIGGQVILTIPHGPGVADEYILLENNMFPDLRPDNTRIEVDVIIRKK